MSLLNELISQSSEIVKASWTRRDGEVVPTPDSLGLGNDCVDLNATFLYADLADSTEIASFDQSIAAEVYKVYLMGTIRIIKSLGGHIRSFDGDRVMGVFIGGLKNTNAAKAGLQINWFFLNILKPTFATGYPNVFPSHFDLKQTVGIDTGKTMVARSGIRNSNDLVWVGRAPNAAAKLSSIREGYATYITKVVFDSMAKTSKYGGNPSSIMWEARSWGAGKEFGVPDVYRSNWWWPIT